MKLNDDAFKGSIPNLDDEILGKLVGIPNVVKAMKMKVPDMKGDDPVKEVEYLVEWIVTNSKASREIIDYFQKDNKQLLADNEKLAAEKQMLLASLNILKKTNDTLRETVELQRTNNLSLKNMYEAVRELVTPVRTFLDGEASVADLRIGFEACQAKVAKLQ
jgi:hypothetical protein